MVQMLKPQLAPQKYQKIIEFPCDEGEQWLYNPVPFYSLRFVLMIDLFRLNCTYVKHQ